MHSLTKNDLKRILSVFGREIDNRAPKAEMVAAMMQLKDDIVHNRVSTEERGDAE